jgi:hypothetical protein
MTIEEMRTIDAVKTYKELEEARARIAHLEEVLETLTIVVGLTPIAGNKDALQEAVDMARAELKAKESKP